MPLQKHYIHRSKVSLCAAVMIMIAIHTEQGAKLIYCHMRKYSWLTLKLYFAYFLFLKKWICLPFSYTTQAIVLQLSTAPVTKLIFLSYVLFWWINAGNISHVNQSKDSHYESYFFLVDSLYALRSGYHSISQSNIML